MIKKFIDKLVDGAAKSAQSMGLRRAKPRFGKRVEVPVSVHGINTELVDERARNVVSTLKAGGYEAYIVGGAVRDLLLGLAPKDFDVATNATPEQVKALFRRAFIIGRRFRIVHVVFGRGRQDRGLSEVIEVSTFRAFVDNTAAEQVSGNERTSKAALAGMTHAVDASGRVLRDNVWGPQDEDATRRDFTVNAMYYDPEAQIVVDYHGGMADAQKRLIRMIGDPAARYREDPVRIIRAIRFAAKLSKLGFTLEPKTAKPLIEMRPLLADVPQSRLFDEMLKLLQTGHAIASVQQLKQLGLTTGIYPLLDLVVQKADQPFVAAALADTDRRVGEGKPVAPSFLLACVLWDEVRNAWQRNLARREHPFPALQGAIDEVFDARIGDVSGRGKLGADMREIWMMQPRFERRIGNTPYSLVEQARFRAGFDFLRLRAETGEIDVTLADWWQEFSVASDAVRDDLVAQARVELQKKPKTAANKPKTHRKGPPKDAAAREGGVDDETDAAQDESHDDGVDAVSSDVPKKRRRRRRKPGGGNGNGNGNGRDTGAGPADGAAPLP